MRADRLPRFLVEEAYFIRRKLVQLFKLRGGNKRGGNHEVVEAVFGGEIKECVAVAVVHYGKAVSWEIILCAVDNVHTLPFFHECNFNAIVEVKRVFRIGITADMIAVCAGEILQLVNRLIHNALPKSVRFPIFYHIFRKKSTKKPKK